MGKNGGYMKINTINIIYTEGLLCGLTVKFLYFNRRSSSFRIPILILGYDRKFGKRLQAYIDQLKKEEHL